MHFSMNFAYCIFLLIVNSMCFFSTLMVLVESVDL